MQYCRPKEAQPCFLYQGKEYESRLNDFLLANGGNEARVEIGGKAHVMTIVLKGKEAEPRFIYVMPGSWVRCLGHGQFTATSGQVFQREYELV